MPFSDIGPRYDEGGAQLSLLDRSVPGIAHRDIGELTRVVEAQLAPPLHVMAENPTPRLLVSTRIGGLSLTRFRYEITRPSVASISDLGKIVHVGNANRLEEFQCAIRGWRAGTEERDGQREVAIQIGTVSPRLLCRRHVTWFADEKTGTSSVFNHVQKLARACGSVTRSGPTQHFVTVPAHDRLIGVRRGRV